MLIEFSVKNFKSIKEKQTLSLVASHSDKTLPENLIHLKNVSGMSNTKLLKFAVVYGANASGKSNLMKAMGVLRDFVISSAVKLMPGDEIDVVPFKFNRQNSNEPTEFEINFIHQNVRYQYGVILDKARIYEEYLYAFPAKQAQRWFSREWISSEKKYRWKFSQHLKGEKVSLKNKTRENISFLSVAAQFNHEQLVEVYKWFSHCLKCMDFSSGSMDSTEYVPPLSGGKAYKDKLISLLQQADLGINDIEIKEEGLDDFGFQISGMNGNKAKNANFGKSSRSPRYGFVHEFKDKTKVVLDEEEESSGTIKFFNLLGPWIDVLNRGCVVAIDEIGSTIHPLLLKNMIRMFNSPKLNPHKAQLIFTTHDVTLLDRDLFRRDQIWFTEKNREEATNLYPLIDYKPRLEESLLRGYLAGRYGAIPILSNWR